MKLTKKFFCPVNGWDCPYWKEDGSCSMVDDGDDPVFECDDAGYFWDEEQPDCFVWVDENGNQYEMQELLEQGYHFINGEPVKPPTHNFIKETLEKILEHWDEEVSFPPDFDEIATNGFRG